MKRTSKIKSEKRTCKLNFEEETLEDVDIVMIDL